MLIEVYHQFWIGNQQQLAVKNQPSKPNQKERKPHKKIKPSSKKISNKDTGLNAKQRYEKKRLEKYKSRELNEAHERRMQKQ